MPQASQTPRRTAPSTTRRVRDTYTDKVYEIPWKDASRDPDENEIEELINVQRRASAPPPEQSLFDRATQPLIRWASPTAHKLSNRITQTGLEQLDDHIYDKDSIAGKLETWNRKNIINPALGFLGGATEGVGDLADDLTNPVDLAATLLSAGSSKAVTTGAKGFRSAVRGLKGAEEIAAAAKYAKRATTAAKVGNALTGSRGAYNVADALGGDDEGNIEWHKLGTGALEAILSTHGFNTAGRAGKINAATEGGHANATQAAIQQAAEDAIRAKAIRRASIQDLVDEGPTRRAEHANPVWSRPERKGLPSGRTFYGYGDVIGDATGRDPVQTMRDVSREAERVGIQEDNAGRIIPRRSAPNVDVRTRNPLAPYEQADPSGSAFSSSLPSRPARRDLFTRTGSTLPDIDIIPLRSEIVAPVEAAPVKVKSKRGRKAKAKAPVEKPIQHEDPELNEDTWHDDEGIYHDDDSAQGAPDPRPIAKPEPTTVNPYENMPEPVLKVLVQKGDKQAIQALAKRRGETGSVNLGGFVEGVQDVASKVKSRLGDFVSGDSEPRGLGARLGSAAREPKAPKPPRGYVDLTPEVYKRYEVYNEQGTLIDKTYDINEAHTWADENNGHVKDTGETPSSGDADIPVPQPPPSRRVAAATRVKPTTRAEVLQGMPDSKDVRSTIQKATDPFIKSGLTTLEEMGPAGEKISRMYKYLRAEANHEAGKRISELGQASADFNMDERTNLFDVLDGTAAPINPRVANAVKVGRRILDETGIEAEKLGMKLALPSGKKVPFTRHQGPYAPHVFDDAFFKGQNKENLFNTLVKEGKSPDEANHIIEAIKNYGDRLIDPQHTRSLNLKGYRRDPEAISKYLGDMWQKIGEARHLGVEDLADPTSPISQLVKDTNNPQLAHKILNAQLGRTIHDAGMEQFVHSINSAQVAMKLPMFAISNLSQRATPLLKASAGDYVKAIESTMSDKAAARTRAEVSGSLQAVNKQLFQDSGGESRVSRLFQMRRSETANRVFTSEVGRHTVERVFKDLKRNPADKMARKRLDDLLLEDVDTVLKQESLSDKQKSIASYRMNELTQGITDNIDLPELWNGHPSVKLLTLFRKFAFVQTKIIKDAIKENPGRNIPLALLAYTVAGEAVGDTKTAISSLISGKDTEDELKKRGQYKEIGKITARIMKSEKSGAIVGRLAQNLADGFAFGLLDDAISSSLSGKPSGMVEFLGGVNLGDASRVLGGAGRGIANIGKGISETVVPPAKELVRTLPFGRPLANRLFPEEEASSVSGRPRRPSR